MGKPECHPPSMPLQHKSYLDLKVVTSTYTGNLHLSSLSCLKVGYK